MKNLIKLALFFKMRRPRRSSFNDPLTILSFHENVTFIYSCPKSLVFQLLQTLS